MLLVGVFFFVEVDTCDHFHWRLPCWLVPKGFYWCIGRQCIKCII